MGSSSCLFSSDLSFLLEGSGSSSAAGSEQIRCFSQDLVLGGYTHQARHIFLDEVSVNASRWCGIFITFLYSSALLVGPIGPSLGFELLLEFADCSGCGKWSLKRV